MAEDNSEISIEEITKAQGTDDMRHYVFCPAVVRIGRRALGFGQRSELFYWGLPDPDECALDALMACYWLHLLYHIMKSSRAWHAQVLEAQGDPVLLERAQALVQLRGLELAQPMDMQPSGEALTPQGHFRVPPLRVPDPQAVAERAGLRLLADLVEPSRG